MLRTKTCWGDEVGAFRVDAYVCLDSANVVIDRVTPNMWMRLQFKKVTNSQDDIPEDLFYPRSSAFIRGCIRLWAQAQ